MTKVENVRDVLVETHRLIAKFAVSGFGDHEDGAALFVNQGRIMAALAASPPKGESAAMAERLRRFVKATEGNETFMRHPTADLILEAATALDATPAPVESGVVERLTAWLYAREGGVAFNGLPDADQEHWRKQAREVAALATSGEERAQQPVAWRWRYRREGAHWTVCQSPRVSHDACPGSVGVDAEPLYLSATSGEVTEAMVEAGDAALIDGEEIDLRAVFKAMCAAQVGG